MLKKKTMIAMAKEAILEELHIESFPDLWPGGNYDLLTQHPIPTQQLDVEYAQEDPGPLLKLVAEYKSTPQLKLMINRKETTTRWAETLDKLLLVPNFTSYRFLCNDVLCSVAGILKLVEAWREGQKRIRFLQVFVAGSREDLFKQLDGMFPIDVHINGRLHNTKAISDPSGVLLEVVAMDCHSRNAFMLWFHTIIIPKIPLCYRLDDDIKE
ncbi:unnamed protein product, partial [Mesorhabditis spiculigera]